MINGLTTFFNENGEKMIDFNFENGILINVTEYEKSSEFFGYKSHRLQVVSGKLQIINEQNRVVGEGKFNNGELVRAKKKR